MFRSTISIMMILLLAVVFAPADLLAGGDDGPEILWDPCTDFDITSSIRVGTVNDAFPAHSYSVPVDLYLDNQHTAYQIHIKIGFQTGLTYNSVTPVGWEGTISHTVDGNNHTFDLHGTFTLTGDGDYQTLFNLNLTVDSDVEFGQTRSLTLPDGIDFPSLRWEEYGTFCRTGAEPGAVHTIVGQAWFEMGTETAYSYQALDDYNNYECDGEKEVYTNVPLYFKANYPVDRFNITIEDIEEYVGFYPEPSYTAISEASCDGNTLLSYDSDTIDPSENLILLGYLRHTGRDYGDEYYQPPPDYDPYADPDDIPFDIISCSLQDYPTMVYCEGTDIGLNENQFSHTPGELDYPQYRCTTRIQWFYLYPNCPSPVTVPVKANHTFQSQGFRYFVMYDPSDLTFSSVSHPGTPENRYQYAVNTEPSPWNYDQGKNIHKIETHKDLEPNCPIYSDLFHQDNRFIPANSYEEIFSINFDFDQNWANTAGNVTTISFYKNLNPHSDNMNKVDDHFHSDNDKITRYANDVQSGNFILYSGDVFTPKLEVDIDDNVPCGQRETRVPVRITDAYDNWWERMDLEFTCGNPMVFKGIADGDFDVDWEPPDIQNGRLLSVSGLSSQSIETTGTLLYLILEPIEVSIGTTDINFERCDFKDYHDPYPYPQFKYDGSVGLCGLRKADPCGDCPIPYTYFLSQAYPNPFNANTIIEFGLAEPGHVSLDIYDILGKKVRALKSEEMEPGAYQATWDGTNDAGAEVGSGFYFYIIQTSEFTDRKRMTLLK